MTMSSAERAAYGGLFVAAAMIFSYVEMLIPLNALSVPGFKLGLANICVMIAFYYLGAVDAALISLTRILLTALLFGTPVSFIYSLVGGILSYSFLPISKYVVKEKISFIGISVVCASLHNVGQICVASIIFKEASIFWFLEWLLPISVLTGILTGGLALFFGDMIKRRPLKIKKGK